MTTIEARPRYKQVSNPTSVLATGVVECFMFATGTKEPQRITAESRLRKILRKADPVSPSNLPKNLKRPSGEPFWVAHRKRPNVLYRLFTGPNGVKHCDTVAVYNSKSGRLEYFRQ